MSSASNCCQLIPAPREREPSLTATVGFTLIAWMEDLTPWKRPIQALSHSVVRPKGMLTPRPTHHFSATW